CDADCSLREAVIAANADASTDTVILPAGTYALTIAGAAENAGETGDLDILGPVTIQGDAAATTIIDAGGIDRVFHVESGSTRVVFANVTIRGGSAAGAGTDQNGGGIYAFRSLVTILNSVITDNTAQGGGGGVDVNLDSTNPSLAGLNLLGSTVSANTAMGSGGGGGILAGGRFPVRISHGVITGNHNTSGGGRGGGAFFAGSNSLDIVASAFTDNTAAIGGGIAINQPISARFRNTLIEGNTASSDGGGIHAVPRGGENTLIETSAIRGNAARGGGALYVDGGAIAITDSELSGNSATGTGGAVSTIRTNLTIRGTTITGNGATILAGGINVAFGSHLIENSTLAGNTVTSAAGSNGVIGGGAIATSGSAVANMTLVNTTVADNVAPAGGSQLFCGSCKAGSVFLLRNTVITGPPGVPLCAVRFNSGPFTSEGGNLSGDANCDLGDPTDQESVADMMLSALAANGGPTDTRGLQAGSPAIGAAVAANCPAVDQRGFQRDGMCDSGAFEANVSVDNFGCGADLDGLRKQLGYVVEEILETPTVGDILYCLGGLAGAA
ncbi:MAG: hypothetical protein KC466_05970, partial [Myxococcales bacterium]|nr:hypothetical protein [Myxococcales bacterium]